LAADAPASVSPVAVTVLPTATFASANVAAPALHVTVSPAMTPPNVQPVMLAVVVLSYGLFAAVTVAVTLAAVIDAVAAAVVLDSV
jgi:hypothetical protein